MAELAGLTGVIAANVRRLRRERGWSQAELARRAGLKVASLVTCIENGSRNATLGPGGTMEGVAAGLGVQPWFLLYPAEPPACSWCGGRPRPRMTCAECGTTGLPPG